MGSSETQTYCLRWNNHKSNLVEILDALIKMECYVDCTIVVDEQVQFKAHRVVLAANSPYFQSILQDVPMDHCSILFPGVKEFEMRALLEYMYTGEVNVTKSQIPRIMKIAEQLEVKGLFEMHDLKGNFGKMDEQTSSPAPAVPPHHPAFPVQHNNDNSSNNALKTNNNQSSPITSSNNITSAAQSSSSSPPYSNFKPYSNLYPRSRSPGSHTPATDRPGPPVPWTLPHLDSSISSHLSRVYESVADMNPLKRKKLSSLNSMLQSAAVGNPAIGIDTPILRNVLAQSNVADSSQPLPLMSDRNERSERSSNGSNGTDYSDKKYHDRPDEPHSPYTDKSYDEDSAMDQSQGYGSDRIASYVPQQNQKPEWKRYKQYTRNDILSAIECVKNGMSALQASRKFGVPSRTLYDKVKKMGITTGRPMNRSSMKRSPNNGGNSLQFPYGLTGASHSYPDIQVPSQSHSHHDDDRSMERHSMPPHHPAAALLAAPSFLQQALDIRGGDVSLHAMALAAG